MTFSELKLRQAWSYLMHNSKMRSFTLEKRSDFYVIVPSVFQDSRNLSVKIQYSKECCLNDISSRIELEAF